MVMINKEGSTKIVNFMILGVGVLVLRSGHILKLHYLFKNLLLYSQAQIRQTEGMVMMSKEGTTKIVNFMTPGVGVLALGCGQISYVGKMLYSCKNLPLFS